jgi:hypothetical protein
MEQVQDWPPNIEVIRNTFELCGREIFAYGDTIYNPSGGGLPIWLLDHEEVHQEQQAGDPETWWEQYLSDKIFRLSQELEAHQVEFASYCRNNKDRNARANYLMWCATRLASPTYGQMVTKREAVSLIRRKR